MATEKQKRTHAENQRRYRMRHPNYDKEHNNRQVRYIKNLEYIRRIVLTHYGDGKCACVVCGETDIDCLSIDHINNDAHHRQNNGRVGGLQLYRKLMSQGFPKGYQTLCYNHNMKKAIEFCRKNGGNKKGTPQQKTSLPLFEYLDNIGTSGDVKGQSMDVRGTTGDGMGYDSDILTSKTSDTLPIEITHY